MRRMPKFAAYAGILSGVLSCADSGGHSSRSSKATAVAADASSAQVNVEPVSQIVTTTSPANTANASAGGSVSTASADLTGSASSAPQLLGSAAAPPTNGTVTATPAAEQQLVQACLAGWPGNPFGSTKTTPDQTIVPSPSILGLGSPVDDTNVTTAPSLILIDSGISLLGQGTYRLMNPQGWYCLPTESILSTINIQIKAGAHLSEGGTNIDISSSSTNGGISIGAGGSGLIEVIP